MSGRPGVLENVGFAYVGYHDLGGNPAFKMAVQEVGGRWYLYVGHLWRRGWSVLDVTDPAAPQLVRSWDGPAGTWTIQIQAADGRLVCALERPGAGWGVAPDAPFSEGIALFDVSADPTDPRPIGTWRTGATGTHRNFYVGGSLVFAAASRPGYVGNLLVVLDISDPAEPKEIGMWAAPGQEEGAGPPRAYMHGPADVRGERAYVSYGRYGAVILDIADPRAPREISHIDLGALGSVLGCHSAQPLEGRDLLVMNSEAIKDADGDALNYVVVVDIGDEEHPRPLSMLPLPQPQPGLPYRSYYRKGGRFGPHNQHHYQQNPAHSALREHVLLTYFNAGLRLYDVSDPSEPHEVGCFVPEDPTERRGPRPSELVTQFEDVLVDARGVIYCTDKNHGLFVLEYPEGLR